ncbi:MAG: hypothetical protein II840_11805 [Kiritimatiellae bacterium]|nr:hypothetical protein [Kiritimatiellia bacterium]
MWKREIWKHGYAERLHKVLAVFMLCCLIFTFSRSAFALNVSYDGRTPESHREWGDKSCLREHMEVAAKRICEALYGDNGRSHLHENFNMILYLAPHKGGNPAFASGRRITWKVGEHPGGEMGGCPGILIHEMTHVLDMGSDRVFTEAMADWVRYYRCTNPPDVLWRRWKALRGGRNYGKYAAGANFLDFMTQNYGEGTVYKILMGYKQHGKNPWEKLFGKNFDGLIAEWRQMETIYDPVFEWTYNGNSSGVVRHDKKHCRISGLSVSDAKDKSGAWLEGATAGEITTVKDGSIAIALHGWFPSSGTQTAIASLGAPGDGSGKAILLATSGKSNLLLAHVIAHCPGSACQVVSTTKIPLKDMAANPHSAVLTVNGGDTALVVIDGGPAVKIDMSSKCKGCSFAPKFAIGGVSGGFGVSGFSEPKGAAGVRLDDVRVFSRAFRPRETKSYADTFGADYRPAVAVTAEWIGAPGGKDIDSPQNWFCVNAIGERITAVPTKDTAVKVYGKKIPNIQPGAKFQCKSFTIAGIAILDDSIDLRGVDVVGIEDKSRIITRGDNALAVSKLRGERVRLNGKLAVTTAMKLTGKLDVKGGSVLRLPEDSSASSIGELAFSGEGGVLIKPGVMPPKARTCKLLRVEKLPEDLSRLSLHGMDEAGAAEFRQSTDKKFLTVYWRK